MRMGCAKIRKGVEIFCGQSGVLFLRNGHGGRRNTFAPASVFQDSSGRRKVAGIGERATVDMAGLQTHEKELNREWTPMNPNRGGQRVFDSRLSAR